MPPSDQNQLTGKQQVTELLKQAQTLLITTSKNPGVDEVAAVIALAQMLEKMGKRTENVVSVGLPSGLDFLPQNIVHKDFAGIRDFVIELDTSKTEADKLKYIPEGKRLKIFITPYNGNFNKEDLGFSYGDFHCDVVVALGTGSLENLDGAVINQRQLLEKTPKVFITTGQAGKGGHNQIVWAEPQATSLCEVLMSLTEALQPGLLDNKLATSLLTGIVAKTNHFTATNTTPKVMTMAAQLLAAGADQHMIVEHLTRAEHVKPQTAQGEATLSPSQEKDLPHQQPPQPQPKVFDPTPDLGAAGVPPQLPPAAHKEMHVASPAPLPPRPAPPIAPTPPVAPPLPQPPAAPPSFDPAQGKPTPPPPVIPPMPTGRQPEPAKPPVSGLWGEPPVINPQPRTMVPPPAAPAQPPVTPSQTVDTPPTGAKIDIEAARRAVEEATHEVPPVQMPDNPPAGGPPTQ